MGAGFRFIGTELSFRKVPATLDTNFHDYLHVTVYQYLTMINHGHTTFNKSNNEGATTSDSAERQYTAPSKKY